MDQKNKNNQVTHVTQLITGVGKRFPNADEEVTFGGVKRTVAQVIAMLQGFVDLVQAVGSARASLSEKITAERSQKAALIASIDALVSFLRARFGNSPEALADFGLAPHGARTKMTAEQKAVAAAKRAATREARGTKGPRQKEGIHGKVQVDLVVKPEGTPGNGAPHA